jgi:hypothetical protein
VRNTRTKSDSCGVGAFFRWAGVCALEKDEDRFSVGCEANESTQAVFPVAVAREWIQPECEHRVT